MQFHWNESRDIGTLAKDLAKGALKVALGGAGLYATAEYAPEIYRFFTQYAVADPLAFLTEQAFGLGVPTALGVVSGITAEAGLEEAFNFEVHDDYWVPLSNL
ncbi:MAG: hypothetical protein ABH879_10540 [archaeon]